MGTRYASGGQIYMQKNTHKQKCYKAEEGEGAPSCLQKKGGAGDMVEIKGESVSRNSGDKAFST